MNRLTKLITAFTLTLLITGCSHTGAVKTESPSTSNDKPSIDIKEHENTEITQIYAVNSDNVADSELIVRFWVDPETGIEYIVTPNGITPRLDPTGHPRIKATDNS